MIHALHGNFGLPTDWDAALPPGVPAMGWPLWEIRRRHPETRTLTGFATWLNNEVAALPGHGPRVLAGYSMGGRLALHVLLDRPSLWHHAILLSTHPGLTTPEERTARLAHDAGWQARCQSRDWEEVAGQWNHQPILQGRCPVPKPAPSAAWRAEIASAFDGWSLGCQENLLPSLARSPVATTWLAGELDPKFHALAAAAARVLPCAGFQPVPGAGHRLLLEQPGRVQTLVTAAWSLAGLSGSGPPVGPLPCLDRNP